MTDFEFEKKYKLYNKLLFSIIYGYTLNEQDSNDILQDVFIKYINLDKKFDDLDSEKYYLIRMTINMCKNHYKKYKNIEYLDNDDIPDEKNNNYVLRYIIKNLPQKYKEVIILYYYDSYDIKSISKILKISVDAVKKRLERAKDKIREELGDEYETR